MTKRLSKPNMVEGCLKMVELVIVAAVLDDDHGLVVLNPDVDPVGHDADLIDVDVDLVDLDGCTLSL